MAYRKILRSRASMLAPFLVVGLLAGCAPGEETMAFSAPPGEIPFDSESEDARRHFVAGQEAMDVGRFFEAREHFEAAVETDPTFAYAYLNAAGSAASLADYKTHLDAAAARAEEADEGVRILIEIGQRGLDNDVEGQLALAEELVAKYPQSPRAWLTLAGIQASLNRNEEARASAGEALEVDPDFAPAYDALRNSYLFNEPKDLAKAEENARKVVELLPEESNAHENLGDVLRAQGRLEEARAAYSTAAELDPADAVPVLKLGHIDSFLGDYEQARAEYDQAIERAREGESATFPNYRAFTWVHEGQPRVAVEELGKVLAAIDGLGLPPDQARGTKIFTLTNQVQIAIHHGMYDVAERALTERARLMMEGAEVVGTPEFRRGQEANVTFWRGVLAANRGDFAAAQQAIEEFSRLVEPDRNPRKMEPAHYLMGLVALKQGNPQEAVPHLRQADPGNMYVKYQLAVALEQAGETEEARRVFQEVANFNFNSVDFALVRKDAMQRLETEETEEAEETEETATS